MIALLASLVLTASAGCADVPSARGYADTPPAATIVAGVLTRSDDGTYERQSVDGPLAPRIDYIATLRIAPGQSYAFRLEGQARRLRVVPHAHWQYVFEVDSGEFGGRRNCFTVANRTARPLEAEVYVDEGDRGQRRRRDDRNVRYEYALSYRPFTSDPEYIAPPLPSGGVDALLARVNEVVGVGTRVSIQGGNWEIRHDGETRRWPIAERFLTLNPALIRGDAFGTSIQEVEPPSLAFPSALSTREQFRLTLSDQTMEGRARSRSVVSLRSGDAARQTELFSLLYEIRRQVVGDPIPPPAPDWRPSPTRPPGWTLGPTPLAEAPPVDFAPVETRTGTLSAGDTRTRVAFIPVPKGDVLLISVEADEGRRLHFDGGLGDETLAFSFRDDGRAYAEIPAPDWIRNVFVSVEREPRAGEGTFTVAYRIVDESQWLVEQRYRREREGATRLVQGETVTGVLSESTAARAFMSSERAARRAADRYLLAVQDGAPRTLRMESTAFDPYLLVLDEAGRIVARSDDHSLASRAAQLTLTEPGEYIVQAGMTWTPRFGPYTLSVTPATPGDAARPETYTVGARSTPRIITDSTRAYSFSTIGRPIRADIFNLFASDGQTVRFRVEAEGFEPYLFMLRGDGVTGANVQGEAGALEVEVEDLVTGKYRLLIGTLDPEATGAYTLHRELTEPE